MLRDPDDAARIAAVQALGTRCGERTHAYLRLTFAQSDARVRAPIATALQACGVDLAQTLHREEAERRRKAVDALTSPFAAVRARGARELGVLGRDEDRARLSALLDDRDGVVVAAAARALGESGAQEAAARLGALLGEVRAVRALEVPGQGRTAAEFAADPDPVVSAAARGDPPPTPGTSTSKPAPEARLSLWSDDGAVRARACKDPDPSLAATRALLANADPERRVRNACASTNETAHRK